MIEGLPSVILAIVVFFALPSRPDKSKYITEAERTVIHTRLNTDSLGEGHIGIDWRGVRRALTDWKTYAVALMYSSMNLTLGSVSGFLPTIIKGCVILALHVTITYSPINIHPSQAWIQGRGRATLHRPTVCCRVCDDVPHLIRVGPCPPSRTLHRLRLHDLYDRLAHPPQRAPQSARALLWLHLHCHRRVQRHSLVRPSLLHLARNRFLLSVRRIMSWQANNTGSQSQRAVSLGMLNTVGQCLAILASFSFPSEEGPRYIKGISLNIAFNALGFCIALGMSLYYRAENARRDRVEGGRPPKGEVLDVVENHDLAHGFRYVM